VTTVLDLARRFGPIGPHTSGAKDATRDAVPALLTSKVSGVAALAILAEYRRVAHPELTAEVERIAALEVKDAIRLLAYMALNIGQAVAGLELAGSSNPPDA
jgi:hypothetical protein